MKTAILASLACAALTIVGCGESAGDPSTKSTAAVRAKPRSAQPDRPQASGSVGHRERVKGPEPEVVAPTGPPPPKLVVADLKKGSGVAAKRGDELTVQFVCIRYTTGEHFESSWENGKTFTFRLDSASVNPGWVRGLPGMRVGGRRRLIVPPKMTSRYALPSDIGPEATLVYVIDLLEARPA